MVTILKDDVNYWKFMYLLELIIFIIFILLAFGSAYAMLYCAYGAVGFLALFIFFLNRLMKEMDWIYGRIDKLSRKRRR